MRFEGINIKDIKQGQVINGIYILRKKDLRETANKKPFLDLYFIDSTGEINAKFWDADETYFQQLTINQLYYVNAKVDRWRENLQLNINRMRPADEKDQNKIADFVPSAPIQPENMLEEIYCYANKIVHADIKKLVLKMLQEKEQKLLYYPAARSLHHSIRSGLLYHLLRMLKMAEKLKQVYTEINEDLLIAGVLIHDLAKMGELDSDTLGFSEYTKEGQLLGHISMGMSDIETMSRELDIPSEVTLVLKHMVAAHHYEPEYGSPKKPMFLEAELLHHLDLIDARVYDYENALKNVEKGSFSDPVWSLDKRRIYKVNL